MEKTLKRLLEAEQRAEAVVRAANAKHDEIIKQAKLESQAIEQSIADQSAQIRKTHIDQAEARAQQAIIELERRSDDHQKKLRSQAQERETQALEAVYTQFITYVER